MSLILTGCKSQKPIIQKQSTVNIDSLLMEIRSLTEINREINDRTIIAVPEINTGNPDCDSICNAEREKWLLMLNREIQSGNNRYQLLYNEHNKTLEILAKIAATTDQHTETNKSQYKGESKEVVREVPVPFIPKFIKYSAWFGWACAVYCIIKLIFKYKTSWLQKKSIT